MHTWVTVVVGLMSLPVLQHPGPTTLAGSLRAAIDRAGQSLTQYELGKKVSSRINEMDPEGQWDVDGEMTTSRYEVFRFNVREVPQPLGIELNVHVTTGLSTKRTMFPICYVLGPNNDASRLSVHSAELVKVFGVTSGIGLKTYWVFEPRETGIHHLVVAADSRAVGKVIGVAEWVSRIGFVDVGKLSIPVVGVEGESYSLKVDSVKKNLKRDTRTNTE